MQGWLVNGFRVQVVKFHRKNNFSFSPQLIKNVQGLLYV